MIKKNRDAILELLPVTAFVAETRGRDQIDAYWTTKTGRFSLVTAHWSSSENWDTRVTVTALHSGENVTLRTENPQRILDAINLLGGL